MINRLFAIILALGISTHSSKLAWCSEIRLQEDRGVLTLPVRINDAITLDFVLDSGASDVSIPEDVVRTLIRTKTISGNDFLPGQTYIMADGSKTYSPRFVIKKLAVGEIEVFNVEASVAAIKGELLLGQSFLKRFNSWKIDNQKVALIFNSLGIPTSQTQEAEKQVGIIRHPVSDEEVPRVYFVKGSLDDNIDNQKVFLIVQSTAKNFGEKYYPQGVLTLNNDRTWSIRTIYASKGYSYRTFLVKANNDEAFSILAREDSKLSGLSTLPTGTEIISNKVTVLRN